MIGGVTRKLEAAASDGETLRAYLREIAKAPRLTVEEERALASRIQDNQDEKALGRLVESNLRFVVSYAKRYRGLGVSFLDLIHEGNLGLMEAARRFDPSRNVKFITYAVWWVRQAIMHALSDQARAFSLPPKLSGVAARFGRDVSALAQQLDHAPTTSEIAADLDISESDVDALLQISGDDLSLSDRIGSDGHELGDTIEQDVVPPVEGELLHEAFLDELRHVLSELDEREQEVVRLRYGLDDGEPLTLQEIGDRMKLSRERIRQIEARAKEKIRRSKKAHELLSYLN
jgi:RNA polymerase primary sigma factor